MKALAFACLALTSLVVTNLACSQQHAFSVKDDIGMVRFSDPNADTSSPVSEDAKTSPDGKLVAVVTTRGVLKTDQIRSSLIVFHVNAIHRFLNETTPAAPEPHFVASVVSYPHREQLEAFAPVIKDLRWSTDSAHLYFRGEDPQGDYQLYEADADGSGTRTLTPSSEDVGFFDVSGNVLVYTYSQVGSIQVAQGRTLNADALDVTGYRLMDILFPRQMLSYQPRALRLAVIHLSNRSRSTNRVPGFEYEDIPLALQLFPFRISPHGDQLITVTPLKVVPPGWVNYQPAPAFQHRRLQPGNPAQTNPDNSLRPREYSLVNLSTGQSVPLIRGPMAAYLGYFLSTNTVSWASDESRVLVTNMFLPLRKPTGTATDPRTFPCAVASVDLPSMNARCLFFESSHPDFEKPRVDRVAFGRNANHVLVFEKIGATEERVERFGLQGQSWHLIAIKPESLNAPQPSTTLQARKRAPGALDVFVQQGLNTPPALWAKNRSTGNSLQIWDPNPQFAHMRFGQASVFHWKDKSGREWTGGLVKPVGYVAGQRYPCVIQMYEFYENQFLTDGTDPTAFTAREFASAGFVVLQIRKKPSVLSEADPAIHLEAYRSAIDSLADAGLIDRNKVGVVGFSWTCWYVINALIKDPHLFQAATIADGLDNSYMQYILFSPGPPNTHLQMDKIRGASPFGDGLKLWVRDAPGFHLDRVETPVRIEAINPTSVLQEWELYASLYLQGKPVDMIYFPRGTHIHQRPLERLESQQGNVDWMRFWLQDYVDPDPAKRAQYALWQKLKNEEPPHQSSVVP